LQSKNFNSSNQKQPSPAPKKKKPAGVKARCGGFRPCWGWSEQTEQLAGGEGGGRGLVSRANNRKALRERPPGELLWFSPQKRPITALFFFQGGQEKSPRLIAARSACELCFFFFSRWFGRRPPGIIPFPPGKLTERLPQRRIVGCFAGSARPSLPAITPVPPTTFRAASCVSRSFVPFGRVANEVRLVAFPSFRFSGMPCKAGRFQQTDKNFLR